MVAHFGQVGGLTDRGETVPAPRTTALPRQFGVARDTPNREPSSEECETLVDLLSARAQARADHVYFVYLEDGINESEWLTFGDLDLKARAIASGLGDLAPPGERVILVYPPGTAFMAGFLGCLYGGIIAVPAPPIGSNRNGAGLARLASIAESSKARVVLTHSSIAETLSRQLKESRSFENMTVVCGDLIDQGELNGWSPPEIGPDTIAYLQYSSGSTDSPKGVVLTHRSVLANLAVIHAACDARHTDSLVTWLPHFHDMGLASSLLQPLFSNGHRVWTMSPKTFVKHPDRWLQAISRYKATSSAAPTFAYELCTHRVTQEQLAEMDLSSWRVALCGAEPIRPDTLRRFAAHCSTAGFRENTFLPCYGLAEAVVMVTGGPTDAGITVGSFDTEALAKNRLLRTEEGGRELVASGALHDEPQVMIVDPDTLDRLPAGRIGEICIGGASVCSGYWDNESATELAFDHGVQSDQGTRYLRTGDLGCVLDGQLYVTGRRKDLIIRYGHNHYPHDLEKSAEASHTAIRPFGCAAFSVEDGTAEKVVMVVEVARSAPAGDSDEKEVVDRVRNAISNGHGLFVDEVCLVDWLTIPLTSSGKVQRFTCKQMYLSGAFAGT
jgi:acyl-CoA synthetase (AMP-forming)/AMP-acid ligase II